MHGLCPEVRRKVQRFERDTALTGAKGFSSMPLLSQPKSGGEPPWLLRRPS